MSRRRPQGLVLLTLCALALGACSSRDAERLRVGAKSFAEQRILAQALRELARRADIGVAPVLECGDTHGCRHALRSGGIDLMVEYTGTVLAYRGSRVPNGTSPLSVLQQVDAPLGLRWLPLLGFDNGYRLAVTTQRAAAQGLRTIADLARQPVGLRVACPRTYVGRPRDGLAPLLSRYGLKLLGPPLLLDDPVERLHALASGRADVAVVYGTDGSLRTAGVTLLQDSASFFAAYQAAVVVRESALRRLPHLRASLEQLSGRIDETTMRQANYGVQLEHRSVRRVAEQLLQKLGLITALRTGRRSSELLVAVAASDALDGPTQRALRAIHVAFPDRPARVQQLHRLSPLVALKRGQAHLALVGAEALFTRDRAGLRRVAGIDVAAVVTRRLLHLVRRSADNAAQGALAGRIGIEPPSSSAGVLVAALLRESGISVVRSGKAAELLADLRGSKLDAVLILAESGAPPLARALGAGGLTLLPLPRLAAAESFAFLRPSRLPARSYHGQDRPLETLATQLVLVAPGRAAAEGVGGPAEAARSTRPLSEAERRALRAATSLAGAPDPLLSDPSARRPRSRQGRVELVLDRLLNALTLAFLGWLVLLLMRRDAVSPKGD